MEIETIAARQREYFLTGQTKEAGFRIAALRKLQKGIIQYETDILSALRKDLNKSHHEGYMTEVGMALSELRYMLRHMRKWTKLHSVPTPLMQFHARSFIVPEPYGVVLIISPWNYPFQLSIGPLVGAIAAGNCAVIKPSEYAPHTSRAVAELAASCFPPEYITVVEGGRTENVLLLKQKFDYIFFTGSVEVGRVVMEAASRNLTPVTLELGGKSPCIVDDSADIKTAARRLAFGKFLNAGQTCVAPDYLLIHKNAKERFIELLKSALDDFFPNRDYQNLPAIINDKHYNRLMGLIRGEKILLGGGGNLQHRLIEPTILDEVSLDSAVMKEEIMGPILPIISFSSLDEVITIVRSMPKPLALYMFSESHTAQQQVLNSLSFGGGCINDTVMHLTSPHLAFGGVGDSGIGSYHGKHSFDTFTHYKSILKKYNWIDIPLRYQPYSRIKSKLIRLFLK